MPKHEDLLTGWPNFCPKCGINWKAEDWLRVVQEERKCPACSRTLITVFPDLDAQTEGHGADLERLVNGELITFALIELAQAGKIQALIRGSGKRQEVLYSANNPTGPIPMNPVVAEALADFQTFIKSQPTASRFECFWMGRCHGSQVEREKSIKTRVKAEAPAPLVETPSPQQPEPSPIAKPPPTPTPKRSATELKTFKPGDRVRLSAVGNKVLSRRGGNLSFASMGTVEAVASKPTPTLTVLVDGAPYANRWHPRFWVRVS